MADAVQRRIADPTLIDRELPHLTGRGAGLVRGVTAVVLLGARSAPEVDFLDVCADIPGLPTPLLNCLLELPCGRRISPDALFLEAAVIHETNGRSAHEAEDLFESMQSRHDALTAAGFTVLHNSPRQLREARQRVSGEVLACVTRGAGRGLPPGVLLLRPGP
jgi:hypothetical protein